MSHDIIDLEKVVKQWAWEILKITKEKVAKSAKPNDLTFDINWKRLRISTEKPEYSEKYLKPDSMKNVVFKAVFENRTDEPQEYHFSTERATVSKCITKILNGFTSGWSVGLDLAVPYEVVSVTGCYGKAVTMETEEESEVEEVVSWSADTSVSVKPHHRSTVRLEISETQFKANFRLLARLRGHVVVHVLNMKDNSALLEVIEGDISEILQSQVGLPETGAVSLAGDGKTVLWRVSGTCDFMFGVEQRVVVEDEAVGIRQQHQPALAEEGVDLGE